MNKITFFIIIVFLTILSHHAFCDNVPKIVLLDEKKDLGIIENDGELKIVFTVKNNGSETLKITKVHSTCDCLIIKKYDSIVERH